MCREERKTFQDIIQHLCLTQFSSMRRTPDTPAVYTDDARTLCCRLLPSQRQDTSISSATFLHNTLGTTPSLAVTMLPVKCLSCLGRTVRSKHGVSILRGVARMGTRACSQSVRQR